MIQGELNRFNPVVEPFSNDPSLPSPRDYHRRGEAEGTPTLRHAVGNPLQTRVGFRFVHLLHVFQKLLNEMNGVKISPFSGTFPFFDG